MRPRPCCTPSSRSSSPSARTSTTCSIALIDLDWFKRINDAHGHAMGDHLLVAIAARLRHLIRGEDLLGRLGGDEFVVISRHERKTA